MTDHGVAHDRSTVFEFIRCLGQPVWLAEPTDSDRYVLWLRRDRWLATSTIKSKAWVVGRFFDFVISRYQRGSRFWQRDLEDVLEEDRGVHRLQFGVGVRTAQGVVVPEDLLDDVTVHWPYLPSATTARCYRPITP